MIVIKNLSYDSPAGEPIFRDISTVFAKKKIALIGRNGSGKTTLLRLIVGELTASAGRIDCGFDLSYMPQDYRSELADTLSEALGIREKLDALAHIKKGSANEKQLVLLGDDWDIEDRANDALRKMRLDAMELNRTLATLSGGERIKVMLARLLLSQTDFLILDEPTNNLDAQTKESVYEFISSWEGGMLIVSHDRQLLGEVDEIVELSARGLRTYGGNYEDYLIQKQTEEEALERQLTTAGEELQKSKKKERVSKEKQQKRNSHGKKTVIGQRINKGAINEMISQANATTGKLKLINEHKVEIAEENFEEARSRMPETNKIHIDLSNSSVPNGKMMAEFKDVSFSYEDMDILRNMSFTITGPERIALTGPNGAGKTTLVRLLMGELQPQSGTIRRSTEYIAYLDQQLTFLESDKSLLENLRAFSGMSEAQGRDFLARFLFDQGTVFKAFGALSGGERIRAALACLLAQKELPELLILDEPTNNLDLPSLERLESALSNYEGALLFISHDQTFLDNIGIEREIRLGQT